VATQDDTSQASSRSDDSDRTTRDPSQARPRDEDAFEQARDVVEDSERLASDVRQLYEQITGSEDVRSLYEDNPYAFLAAAAGTGYVLGGGLLTPFTKRLARIGMKAVFVPVALSRLKELTESLPQDEELPIDPPESQ
jgi:ElaB/YqjD/DUF883 family membrane-anchored ribosome-binding protein